LAYRTESAIAAQNTVACSQTRPLFAYLPALEPDFPPLPSLAAGTDSSALSAFVNLPENALSGY